MGLCYLELNAALGTGLGTDWPVAVDHAATMETSWVAALAPDLVATDRLPDDAGATIVGVYGPNPRFTMDAARARSQVDAAAALLAERAASVLRGDAYDPFADLRTFVDTVLAGAARPRRSGGSASRRRDPRDNRRPCRATCRGSRSADGEPVPADGLSLINPTPGETGIPIAAADLGPERGFYVRRLQTAEIRLPRPVAPGMHEVDLTIGLAGVTEARFVETVDFS